MSASERLQEPNPLTRAEVDTLESILDKRDAASVLSAVAQICRLKAVHLQENWQDNRTAKFWLRAAERIENLRGIDV